MLRSVWEAVKSSFSTSLVLFINELQWYLEVININKPLFHRNELQGKTPLRLDLHAEVQQGPLQDPPRPPLARRDRPLAPEPYAAREAGHPAAPCQGGARC